MFSGTAETWLRPEATVVLTFENQNPWNDVVFPENTLLCQKETVSARKIPYP